MADGSLLKAMEAEHCSRNDSKQPFDTSNGMKGVTSAAEWEFVIKPNTTSGHDYPERGGSFRKDHPGWCRKPLELSVFKDKLQRKNAELKEANQAEVELIEEELVGGRLCAPPSRSGSLLVHPPPLCTAACTPHWAPLTPSITPAGTLAQCTRSTIRSCAFLPQRTTTVRCARPQETPYA